MDPHTLVPLAESTDAVELASWKSLLAGAGIAHVVQGEHHASLLAGPLGNPAIVPRVLVAAEDLERATELLAARPVREHPSEAIEGTCAVHERPATGTCDRCGSFVCADCGTRGVPPVCDSCESVEERELELGRERGRQFKRRVVIALLVLAGLSWLATMAFR